MAKTKPHHAQPENQKTGEPEAASAETEPASVETTKPSGGPRLKVLNLRFDLEDQRDSELLSRLQNAAKMDRREIEQEVMALLDTVVCA